MKPLSRFLLFLVIAALGSLVLFVISYWLETSLTQQFVADSTELLKHPRYLKSVALANMLFAVLCLVSCFFLPKQLIELKPIAYTAILYCCFSLSNFVIWIALSSLHVISKNDPFYYYFANDMEPVAVVAGSLVAATVSSCLVFWLRRKRDST